MHAAHPSVFGTVHRPPRHIRARNAWAQSSASFAHSPRRTAIRRATRAKHAAHGNGSDVIASIVISPYPRPAPDFCAAQSNRKNRRRQACVLVCSDGEPTPSVSSAPGRHQSNVWGLTSSAVAPPPARVSSSYTALGRLRRCLHLEPAQRDKALDVLYGIRGMLRHRTPDRAERRVVGLAEHP